jgi:hypothetical protein
MKKEHVTNDQAIKLLEKEFVPYEIARQMYLYGYDEPCFAHYSSAFAGHESYLIIGSLVRQQEEYYNQLCSAPLKQQAFRWFKEKYQLNGIINYYPNVKKWDCSAYSLLLSGMEYVKLRNEEDRLTKYDTYEEAELESLKKLIELAIIITNE